MVNKTGRGGFDDIRKRIDWEKLPVAMGIVQDQDRLTKVEKRE